MKHVTVHIMLWYGSELHEKNDGGQSGHLFVFGVVYFPFQHNFESPAVNTNTITILLMLIIVIMLVHVHNLNSIHTEHTGEAVHYRGLSSENQTERSGSYTYKS